MDPRLSWLQSFLAVAEERHFRRAADRLNLSTSAVSRHVRLLENAVRTELFKRSTRAVHLTDDGRRLYADLRSPVEAVDRALRAVRRQVPDVIRLAYTEASSHHIIPQLAIRWAEHSSSLLQLVPSSSSSQIAELLDGTVDIGVQWAGPCHEPHAPPDRDPRSDQLSTVTLLTAQVFVALASSHPLAGTPELRVQDLARDRWLMAVDSSDLPVRIALVDLCRQEGFEPNIRNAALGNQAQIALVQAGEGVCLVSPQTAGRPVEGAAFARLAGVSARLVAVSRQSTAARHGDLIAELRRIAEADAISNQTQRTQAPRS